MRCERCGRPGVVTIELAVKDERRITMHSCNACEHRSWGSDGEALSLREVLQLVPSRARRSA